MSLIEKVLASHTGAKEREDWEQQAWAAFRKYRGAFGPIIEKEVESAFFTALATGAEYGGHLEFSRLAKERGVRTDPPPLFGQIPSAKIDRLREEAAALNNLLTTATPESVPWTQSVVARVNALNAILSHKTASGPPPWKVEDAFEVWLRRKFPGVRNLGGKLVFGLEDEVKSAFLAGAEYGAAAQGPMVMTLCPKCAAPLRPRSDGSGDFESCAECGFGAAGSETTHSENRTDAASLGEDVASVGAKYDNEKARGRKYQLTSAVHPETVVRWFLELKHLWFDESLGRNLFTGQWNAAFKYLCGWIETGELPKDRTLLEIQIAGKFQEWLDSSWEVIPQVFPGFNPDIHTVPQSEATEANEKAQGRKSTRTRPIEWYVGDSESQTSQVSEDTKTAAPKCRPVGDKCFYMEGKTYQTAIPSREDWQLERCRSLIFAILDGISATTTDALYTNDTDPVGDWIHELGELWASI